MVFRCILSDSAKDEYPSLPRVQEGEFTEEQLRELNDQFYSIYYLPNYPSFYAGGSVDGSQIDVFEWVFVDFDFKDGIYSCPEDVYAVLDIPPTKIVHSGNGIHAYWRVSDLDPMSYLKLSRRLMRKYQGDPAVGKLHQLMRYPGYNNPKGKNNLKLCHLLYEDDCKYTSEELDKLLPRLSPEDEEFCKNHYAQTNGEFDEWASKVSEKMPPKWGEFLLKCAEAKEIWLSKRSDRSGGDFRLGFLMHGYGFTKEEAAAVLRHSAKALERSPQHQLNYARGIVEKIWTYDINDTTDNSLNWSKSAKDLLAMGDAAMKGQRFECHKFLDNTDKGWRLGQVIGLVAGSGVGKTTLAMNMFKWFVELNPGYVHFFVTLEQPDREIAERWQTVCNGDDRFHDKVQVMTNYDEDGTFRHLSLDDIRDYLLKFQRVTKLKVGAVVIDHIGALKKKTKDGENQGIIDICHSMKAFAIATNTMVVMQSQAPREKAGIGDIELNKDAAYGTVFFESYVDYLIALWQPLKRCYADGAPTTMALKFCKIRHKKQHKDVIQEDVNYRLFFDPQTEQLRALTELEEKSFDYFLQEASNKRKRDRNEVTEYVSRKEEDTTSGTNSSKEPITTIRTH